MLYVLEANNNLIVEVRGEQMRTVSIQSGQICCPALSFVHNAIMWFDAGNSLLHVQGLTNTSPTQSYGVDGQHVFKISYLNGKIYWSQKLPMGIYYKDWETTGSAQTMVVEYSNYMIISDFALVDFSKQPLSGEGVYMHVKISFFCMENAQCDT